MSEFSPSPIGDGENLSRFVFSPMHIHRKTGEILPSVFSHVFSKGCSIQREDFASDEEISAFVTKFLTNVSKASWNGVLLSDSKKLRNITIERSSLRALCLYDTAEKDNPAHGEIHQSREMNEADLVELRNNIKDAFSAESKLPPNTYRNGAIIRSLDNTLSSRVS